MTRGRPVIALRLAIRRLAGRFTWVGGRRPLDVQFTAATAYLFLASLGGVNEHAARQH